MAGKVERVAWAVFIWTGIGACTDSNEGRGEDAAFERRDSAGVEIVEYLGETPERVAFELDPVYRHGFDDGDYLYQFIFRGAVQPDGSVLVGDAGSGEVLRIAADGSAFSVLAARGEGPNELRQGGAILVEGQDTIWIEDDGNGKYLRFVDGEFDRSISTQADRALSQGFATRGMTGSGDLLGTTGSYNSRFEQPWLEGHLMRLEMEGPKLDTVGTFDMAARRVDGEINPFGYSGTITASGGQFVQARTDRPELIWRSADGGVARILRWAPVPVYPSEADWEAFKVTLGEELTRVNPRMNDEQVREMVAESIERYRFDPEQPMALFGSLHGDAEGGVWLSTASSFGMESREYMVVAPDGEWLGRVTFPETFRVLDIRGDLVLGQVTDDFDVQGVATYRLRSPDAR